MAGKGKMVKLGSPVSVEADWAGRGIMRTAADTSQISSFPSEWYSPLLSFVFSKRMGEIKFSEFRGSPNWDNPEPSYIGNGIEGAETREESKVLKDYEKSPRALDTDNIGEEIVRAAR